MRYKNTNYYLKNSFKPVIMRPPSFSVWPIMYGTWAPCFAAISMGIGIKGLSDLSSTPGPNVIERLFWI